MNKLNWWPLANSLVEFLKQQKDSLGAPVFDGVGIYAGTRATGKGYPCIEVTFDSENDAAGDRALTTLWVDILLKSNSSTPSDAYELLFKYQTEFMNLLPLWIKWAKKEIGIAAIVKVPSVMSDGDVQRPVCQSRIILEIEWRNSI